MVFEGAPQDNRGGGFFEWSYPPTPHRWFQGDTNGTAGDAFRVSPYPGDNFRAVAGFGQGEVLCYEVQQNDGTLARLLHNQTHELPPTNRYTQDLLTVWRRFHVERDSMQAILNTANSVFGWVSSSGPGWAWITWGYGDTLEVTNRFFPGILRDTGTGTLYNVLANTWGSSFLVFYTPSVAIPVGRLVVLYDDDFDLTANPPASRNLLPSLPGLSVAQSAYAAAYVAVDDEGGIWNETTVDARPYLPDIVGSHNLLWSSRGGKNRGNTYYWIGYALAGFQFSQDESYDPWAYPPAARIGFTYPKSGTLTWGAVVFLEVVRDKNAALGQSITPDLVIGHEVTHEMLGGGHALVEGTIVVVSSSSVFKINAQIPADSGLNIVEDPVGTNGSVVRVGVSGFSWRCKGTLKDYSNVTGGCWITCASGLTPMPQVGDIVYVESKSLMSPEAGAGTAFCPKYLDLIRRNLNSPLE